MSTPTAYSDELQFIRYSDGSRSGPVVTFRLPDREYLDRFIGKEGKRYAAVLVEIGDDEKPVEQAVKPEAKGGELSKWAALRCKDVAFLRWGGFQSEVQACDAIYRACRIESRAELDSNETAKQIFNTEFREPFAAWCKARGV